MRYDEYNIYESSGLHVLEGRNLTSLAALTYVTPDPPVGLMPECRQKCLVSQTVSSRAIREANDTSLV